MLLIALAYKHNNFRVHTLDTINKKIKYLSLSVFVLLVGVFTSHGYALDSNLAFKNADGYGKYTQGGRDGKIYIVNSLEDNPKNPAKGTLRHALKRKYKRTVVFNISGVIHIKEPIIVKSGFLTIAGQTSPGGITVAGAPVQVSDADHIIIRYMRFRLGTFKLAEDSMSVRNSRDIIIDHCSFSWSVDETASFYNNQRFTLQNSIVAASLNHSIHPKGRHGYGGIWGGNKASFINNVIAHHNSRTPRLNGSRLKPPYDEQFEFVEFSNNIIFNWGSNNVYGSENGRFNLINNIYKPGPASKVIQLVDLWYSPNITKSQAYISGNYFVGDEKITADNRLGVNYRTSKDAKRKNISMDDKRLSRVKLEPINGAVNSATINSTQKTYSTLIKEKNVGANFNANGMFLDNIDTQVLNQVDGSTPINGKGLINSELEMIKSWEEYERQFLGFPDIIDKNKDGINDRWAAKNPTNQHNINAYVNSITE